jgi:hypothetical protein
LRRHSKQSIQPKIKSQRKGAKITNVFTAEALRRREQLLYLQQVAFTKLTTSNFEKTTTTKPVFPLRLSASAVNK